MTSEQDRARVLNRCLMALDRDGIVETLRHFADNEEVAAVLEWYERNIGELPLVRN